MELSYKELTTRRRPHFQPLEATLFVTFRLADSIPKSTVRYYKARKEWLRDQLRRCERLVEEDGSDEKIKWREEIERLNRECFIKYEVILHRQRTGQTWLRDDGIAEKVADNLHRLDGDLYRLAAFSIMSNHVHSIFKPLLETSVLEQILRAHDLADERIPALATIMQALQGRSARDCNLLLGRSGQFWEHESFDHVIRTGMFEKTLRDVLNNPVKAGLVAHWKEYRWNYCRAGLLERFP